MALNDILMERAGIHFKNAGMGPNVLPPNNLWESIGNTVSSKIKEKKDEERRQQNVKKQMENYKQMMESMAGMGGEISDVSKAGNLTEDKVQQRRSNVIGSNIMIPTREVVVGPDGINMKFGFKSASPTDQKSLIEIEKTKSDMAREGRKREFLSEYVKGNLPEGAFLQEYGTLGLTPEEFTSATEARNRLQSLNAMSNQGGTPIPMGGQPVMQQQGIQLGGIGDDGTNKYIPQKLEKDKFGNLVPADYQLDNPTGSEVKAQEASQKALSNFGRMASALKLYSDYYSQALDEGGVGSIENKIGGKIGLAIGGEQGEKLTSTGKLYGQGVEMSLASIPIMTGQNRFVESLRDAIKQTYPSGQEGPKLASSKLEQTLENMYMTSKVLSRLGVDVNNPEGGNDIPDDQVDQILETAGYDTNTKKWNAVNIYKLSPAEQKELKDIKKDVLGSLINKGSQAIGRFKVEAE